MIRAETVVRLFTGVAAILLLDTTLRMTRQQQIHEMQNQVQMLLARVDEEREKEEQTKVQIEQMKIRYAAVSNDIKDWNHRDVELGSSVVGRGQGIRGANTVVMEGHCLPARAPVAGEKPLPKYVFVAGVEGSGHHALKAVWTELKAHQKVNMIVYDQLFHSLGIENHASYHYSSVHLDAHVKAMRPIFDQAAKDGSIVIDAQNSYPMGMYAGPLAHPDLMFMRQLDGKLFDLRVIVLYRNPVDATMSAVRRFQNDAEALFKNHEFQARMVTESLATINNAMSSLPCKKYMLLKYEDFARNPRQFTGPLARILGVPKSHLANAFTSVYKKPPHTDTPEVAEQRRALAEFFTRQQVLWPTIAGASS